VAIAVPNVLFCIVVIVYVGRMLNVNLLEYLREWLRPVVAVLVPISIWLMLGEPAANWWEIFSRGSIGMLAYGLTVAIWEFGLPRLLKPRQTYVCRSYEAIQ